MNAILWLIVLLAGLTLEGISFLNRSDKWLPLTYYIRKYIPKALIALALGWLAQHFDVLPTP